jgi:hypothetical protein
MNLIGWPAAWARDGKAISPTMDSSTNFHSNKDLGTGHEELYSLTFDSSYYTFSIALSNDGHYFSVLIQDQDNQGHTGYGEVRDLLREMSR